jgi:molybdenum cofactor cytidylyltransferase
MKSGIIILAAGASTRLGRSKQMLDVDGETLLMRTVRAALHADAGRVIVVLGANEQQHRNLLQGTPVEIVYNEQWQKGMGNSLKAGLRHLISKDDLLEAVVIAVCDQPLLTSQTITNLFHRYLASHKPIVASRYSGQPGVPVLFDKRYFKPLLEISDGEGAKKIIQSNGSVVDLVDFPGGEIDLDTPDDYDAFKNR